MPKNSDGTDFSQEELKQILVNFISINNRKAQATKVSYTVSVNGQQVDSSFSFPYDYVRILDIISLRRSLCVPNYAISNAFFIITPNRICSLSIDK